MIAATGTKAAPQFLLEPGSFLPALLDLNPVQCGHIPPIPSPGNPNCESKPELLWSDRVLATLETSAGLLARPGNLRSRGKLSNWPPVMMAVESRQPSRRAVSLIGASV